MVRPVEQIWSTPIERWRRSCPPVPIDDQGRPRVPTTRRALLEEFAGGCGLDFRGRLYVSPYVGCGGGFCWTAVRLSGSGKVAICAL